ncbi:pirin family protein [Paenibacillus mucilaginosus]|uniref:Pirin domain-containing protein n=2 Tax=Paenibacillus mucilaginosus TaxID=61624 RepID=H6NHP6_9BACL|nr:pirin family protein [Paenibacillus mucilaginosus]AEI41070.1 Pirin domain protein [Paenibacillus mucilaginosus KNP414]AFC29643.1 Pirin domain-containing protein [Paenibacillus mucilaginosus 3016]MCG7211487.1 pirin family protein [Paenibacillus mucilaginosus]WDM30138.1 pirin family protein [Paenibacillus mucilaginosus]WFA18325.1 pirin family protein [Paenibacillus mucilaginosus]
MISIYPAASRYSADHGWLQSNFSFSFGDYYDPDNTGFGPLRVFNDDTIQGGRGFGAHPHREMEIVSVVLQGELKHEDSTGHSAVTTFGEVQRMSAGTGIIHSEMNPSEEPVTLLQLWFTPDTKGLEPSYETSRYEVTAMKNALLPVVSNRSGEGIAHIHQDMTIYLSELEGGRELLFEQPEGRRIFVFVMEGGLTLNGEQALSRRDAARITGTPSLRVRSEQGAQWMLIDLPY